MKGSCCFESSRYFRGNIVFIPENWNYQTKFAKICFKNRTMFSFIKMRALDKPNNAMRIWTFKTIDKFKNKFLILISLVKSYAGNEKKSALKRIIISFQ